MRTCAVIPAAGRGSRLNAGIPKILVSVAKNKTVWSILRQNLAAMDHIHLIVSPDGERDIRMALAEDLATGFVSLSVQPEPIGMGDAIFRGYSVWSEANTSFIVWGDQVFVSRATCERALARHAGIGYRVVLPLASIDKPYVEYVFNTEQRLLHVRQSREGDVCTPGGRADVGAFVMSVAGLKEAWSAYVAEAHYGTQTNELNFLPFLPFLAAKGWEICPLSVSNALETRGINTPEDLLFFQRVYEDMV